MSDSVAVARQQQLEQKQLERADVKYIHSSQEDIGLF